MDQSLQQPTLRDRAASAAAPVRVSIRNLDFFYGTNKALKSISLDLPDRTVTGMIGPSGCGKSTLLRVLNRMFDLYPNQYAGGEVLIDGVNILEPGTDVNALRSRVGMVFQKPTPFPMSIYENIAFGVKLHEKLPRAEMDARVEWALSRAALWGEVRDRLRSPADVGRTYAFFTLGGITFGIMGPIVTGYLVALTGDFKVALVLCGGLSLVATILVTTLTHRALGERPGLVPEAT